MLAAFFAASGGLEKVGTGSKLVIPTGAKRVAECPMLAAFFAASVGLKKVGTGSNLVIPTGAKRSGGTCFSPCPNPHKLGGALLQQQRQAFVLLSSKAAMTHPEQPAICAASILREAMLEDIPRIMALERIPEFHTMVGTWTEQEHRHALQDPDSRYFMVIAPNGDASGFALLRGILSPHRNLELKRFVIGEPGRGLGRRALAELMAHVFRNLHAHRLWLDAFPTNTRALHIYRKAGFRDDGIFREAIYRDGKFYTLLLLSILDREYAQTSPAP